MPDDVKSFFIADFAHSVCAFQLSERPNPAALSTYYELKVWLTKGLKGIRDVHGISLLVSQMRAVNLSDARLNCATVDNDRGAIVANGRDQTPGHVLVASRNGNVSVVVLCLYSSVINTSRRYNLNLADHNDLFQ